MGQEAQRQKAQKKITGEKKKTACIDFSQGDILYYFYTVRITGTQ
jgi:hypothetical protein